MESIRKSEKPNIAAWRLLTIILRRRLRRQHLSPVVDISGQRFGRLVALRISHADRFKRKVWECACDCGRTAIVSSNNLRSGNTVSCGCALSEASRRNLAVSHARNRGSRNWRYNPSLTTEDRLRRRDLRAIKEWRRAVFERDSFTCVLCGVRGGRLHAHHLDSFAEHRDRRFAVDNGVTLCVRHHKEFHFTRGGERVSCTRDDFDRYQRTWYPHAIGTSNIGISA